MKLNNLSTLNPKGIVKACCETPFDYQAQPFPTIPGCSLNAGQIWSYSLSSFNANVSNGSTNDPFYGKQVYFQEDQSEPIGNNIGPGTLYPIGFEPITFATIFQRPTIWTFSANISFSGVDGSSNPYLFSNNSSCQLLVPTSNCPPIPQSYSDSNISVTIFDGSQVDGDWAYFYNGLIYPAINVQLLIYPDYTGPWPMTSLYGFTDYNDCLKIWHGTGIYCSKSVTNAFLVFDEDGRHDALVERCDDGSCTQVHNGGIDVEFN